MFRPETDGFSAREAKETTLVAPLMRQVLAQSQEVGRTEFERLAPFEDRAYNVRSEVRETNKRRQARLIHSQTTAHRLDAVVRSSKQPVADRESLPRQSDEIFISLYSRAILNDETFALAGAF